MKKICRILILILSIFLVPLNLPAQDKITVAVAANFISTFQEITADFEEKTGVKIDATFSSTGNLYSQIKNGAPYDVFLSADMKRPEILQKEGWTDGTFIYARGQVILWSADSDFCKAPSWREALENDRIKKISIANTATAPYGTAAMEALRKIGKWDALQAKMVVAQTIAQAFQYASTQSVDVGFCALSATASPDGEKGCFYLIPEAPDVIQAACVAKKAKNQKGAERFAAYLVSEDAVRIKKKYGYR
jgi:molybdate transport system substrate-binding protein